MSIKRLRQIHVARLITANHLNILITCQCIASVWWMLHKQTFVCQAGRHTGSAEMYCSVSCSPTTLHNTKPGLFRYKKYVCIFVELMCPKTCGTSNQQRTQWEPLMAVDWQNKSTGVQKSISTRNIATSSNITSAILSQRIQSWKLFSKS